MADAAFFKSTLVATINTRPDLIKWTACGRGFHVYDCALEAQMKREEGLKLKDRVFQCKSMVCWKRQLNLHGFKMIIKGSMSRAMYHPSFQFGAIDLDQIVIRKPPVLSEYFQKRVYGSKYKFEAGELSDDEETSRPVKRRRVQPAEVEYEVASGQVVLPVLKPFLQPFVQPFVQPVVDDDFQLFSMEELVVGRDRASSFDNTVVDPNLIYPTVDSSIADEGFLDFPAEVPLWLVDNQQYASV